MLLLPHRLTQIHTPQTHTHIAAVEGQLSIACSVRGRNELRQSCSPSSVFTVQIDFTVTVCHLSKSERLLLNIGRQHFGKTFQ